MERVLQALRDHGYSPAGERFETVRPGHAAFPLVTRAGRCVVGKLYPPDGSGEAAFANMQLLWRSSFGERRNPPGLPEPIDYLPDLRVLAMERLDGRRFSELGADDP